MFNDLKSLVESILSIIVKSEALEKCKKAKQLINLSLNDKPDLPMEILTADMEKFKNQCEQMKKTIIMLDKDVGECVENANKTKDMGYVTKGVALKRKSDETKSDLKKLEQEYSVLEEKKKKL